MQNEDLLFDADNFYKNNNKMEQDAKELKEGLERQNENKRQKEDYIHKEEDKISDQLFDCRFKDQPSGSEYQLAIERITNEQQTVICNIGSALVETILSNHDSEFDIEGFLDYQLSYSKEPDKKFLDTFGSLFEFGLVLWNKTGIIPNTSKGKRVDAWLEEKREQLKSGPASSKLIADKFISYFQVKGHKLETIEDFQLFFIQKFGEKGIKSKKFFKEMLLKEFEQDYFIPLKDKCYSTHGPDLEIADNFIQWLAGLDSEGMPGSKVDVFFDESIIQKVMKYNGIAFNDISEPKLHEALNDPGQWGKLITVKNKSKMVGIIRILLNDSNSVWLDDILKALIIDTSFYTKKSKFEAKEINLD